MSIKIENLNLRPGDHLFIYINGNAENSIYLVAAKDGTAFVSGPFNNKSRSFKCAIPGWIEVSSEERQSALNTGPTTDKCEHGILWSMECLSCGHSDYIAAAPVLTEQPIVAAPRDNEADGKLK